MKTTKIFNIEKKLKTIFFKILKIKKKISKSNIYSEPTWDSFAHTLLITEIEKQFNVKIPDKQLHCLISYSSILEFFKKKLK